MLNTRNDTTNIFWAAFIPFGSLAAIVGITVFVLVCFAGCDRPLLPERVKYATADELDQLDRKVDELSRLLDDLKAKCEKCNCGGGVGQVGTINIDQMVKKEVEKKLPLPPAPQATAPAQQTAPITPPAAPQTAPRQQIEQPAQQGLQLYYSPRRGYFYSNNPSTLVPGYQYAVPQSGGCANGVCGGW